MTHTELNITHILEDSPRGFANETHVLPLTHAFAERGEEIRCERGGDPNAWAYLYAWDEAPAHLRSACGLLLREFRTAEQYEEFMAGALLPLFSVDPDAYDFTGGQWRSRTDG